MNTLQELFERRHTFFRVEAKHTGMLRRRVECLPGDDVERPAAGVCQALTFGQILLAPLQCPLGPFALFDVSRDTVPLDDLAFSIPQRNGTREEPTVLPIRCPPIAHFVFESLARCQIGAPFLQLPLQVCWMNRGLPA